MKTSLLKVMKAVALASMTIMLANCSNSGGSSTATGTTYAVSSNYCTVGSSGYQLLNGICYVNGVQQSSTSLCTSYGAVSYTSSGGTCYATTTSTGYSYNSAGQCIQTSTGTAVSSTYCISSSLSCNGTYYYSNGSSVGAINCSSSSTTYARNLGSNANIIYYASMGYTLNCSGLTLYSSPSTYATITCQ